MRVFVHNLKWFGGHALRWAACLFIVEAAAILNDGMASEYSFMESISAVAIAAFFFGTLALSLLLPAALLAAYSAGANRLDDQLEQRLSGLHERLTTSSQTDRSGFAIRMVTWMTTVAAAGLMAIIPTLEAITHIQTPLFAAVLSVIIAMVSVAIAAFGLRPVWRRTANLAIGRIPRLPAPWVQLATIAGFGLTGVAAFTVLTWIDFARFLPWRPVVVTGSGVAVFIGLSLWTQHRPPSPKRWRRITVMVIASALYAAGAVTAVRLPNTLQRAPYLVEDAEGVMSAIFSVVVRAADNDGDGYLSWLAQGDCAPNDPRIHPGAFDPPQDGIDQDCDGRDSRRAVVSLPGRHDYPAKPRPRPMPVIFITLDAAAALHMELYGAARKTMPFLTREAKSGVVFNYAFSEGPATRLSFPSIMSSRHNSQIKRKQISSTTASWVNVENSLGTVFSNAGFHTEAVLPDRYFAERIDWLHKGFDYVDKSAVKGACGHHKNGAAVTQAALKRLDQLKTRDKFLLWVHYTDAHPPHRLPEAIDRRFGTEERDIYDRELRLLDDAVKPLFEGIEKRLRGQPHIIALTADHGHAFDPQHEKHHQDHDLSTAVTQVPLIFWSPYGRGTRSDQLAQGIDVMPTLMNMVGIKTTGISGESLLPAILGRPNPDRAIMQQFYLPERWVKGRDPLVEVAVRQGPWVLHQRRPRKERLYNFKTDPFEENDLAATHPKVVKALGAIRESMLQWAYEDWNRKEKTP